ncbi:Peptidyl-prolyl cis-trans isomerase-like 4 [Sorochytrium milnesiophthora]
MSVLLETSLGEIVVDLFVDVSPQTCLNFLKLCKAKYYNWCLFYNIQRNFAVQCGDPQGTGKGGTSVWGLIHGDGRRYFPAEIHPQLKHNKRGLLSMASVSVDGSGSAMTSAGGDVGGVAVSGSQFLITTSDAADYLDGKCTIFGEVAEGMDVLEKINNAYVDADGRPYQDIRIQHTIILDDPFPDPEGLVVPDQSPEPSKEVLESLRITEADALDQEPPEVQERKMREKEAAANALTLEMIGDLPFAEIRPPENILFVCKLNPVTRDEDLELIFSRFGRILSCEVIRDKTTGESLSYAFIEFDEQKSCEDAYFKMDNVLIDDRRIKVDFSQSVSKLHKDWLTARKRQMMGGYGGFDNLTKRRQYRSEEGADEQRGYRLVFDHGAALKGGKEVEDGTNDSRPRSRSPHRDAGNERDRNHERDRPRSERSREHDRDRDRDRERHRERDSRERSHRRR